MEVTGVRAGWRSCTKATGAPCVTTAGTPRMQMSSVGSSAVAILYQHLEGPTLVRAQGTFSWELCTAQDRNPTCPAVSMMGGTTMTVATGKTPESCVHVVLLLLLDIACTLLGNTVLLCVRVYVCLYVHSTWLLTCFAVSHALIDVRGCIHQSLFIDEATEAQSVTGWEVV